MARRRRQNNNRRRPNLTKRKENNRRVSNPQNEQEELEAIQDDLDSEVMAMVRQIFLEKALDRQNIRMALGVGGSEDDLNFFEKGFEQAYPDERNESVDYPYGFKEEEAPEIKRVSRLTTLGGSGNDDTTQTQPDSTNGRR